MTAVAPSDNTVAYIRKKVRRLTASASESALSTSDIDTYLNLVYENDFAYGIKIDQMRSVYTFFTEPYIDRYPLDVNFNQAVRSPMYVDGIEGSLLKDRKQFYNIWPRFPTKFQIGGSSLSGVITGIAQPTNPTQITSVSHNLVTGAVIQISDVIGMTQLNGISYSITVIDANTFSLDGIDNTAYGAYVSGGTWLSNSQTFSFVLPGPFLSKEVLVGGVDTNGVAININDDGNGNLNYLTPNPVVTTPPYTAVYTALNAPTNDYVGKPIPGMHNQNNLNPGLNTLLTIGTVDYVSGQIDFVLPFGVSLALGTLFKCSVSQYQTGRPYTVLFWNNEFSIRPIPKNIHKIEVETYLTPVEFMLSTDIPILKQWSTYLAYLTAQEILRDRQDMEGVSNLEEGKMRQEALVLERQANEEIYQPNIQLFTTTQTNYINGGWSQGGGLF